MPFEILPTLTCSLTPPQELLPWLTYDDELSARLRRRTGDGAELTLLKQDWAPAGWWEKSVLGLTSAKVIEREVIISTAYTPCWYGRTVIPEHTWLKNHVFFERLRQESLGRLVFYSDEVKRVRTHFYAVNSTCIEYYWPDKALIGSETLLWIRLSEFIISGEYPFSLTETLLPGLVRVT